MKLSISKLDALIMNVLCRRFDEEAAGRIRDVMLFGELAGHRGHGIMRLVPNSLGPMDEKLDAAPEINRISALSALIQGHNNPGMLTAALALKEVLEILKTEKIALVGTNGSNSSSGCCTYYVNALAERGYIGLMLAHGGKFVAPYGGAEKMFGTNPLVIGVPTGDAPLVLDMGTAAITFGELRHRALRGDVLPPDTAIDRTGEPTTDPAAALEGALLAFGGPKGAGLSLMIEILSGALTGADFCGLGHGAGFGNLLIGFSPELLCSAETFRERVQQLALAVKNSRPRGEASVRLPGEETFAKRAAALAAGEVEVDDKILSQLREAYGV